MAASLPAGPAIGSSRRPAPRYDAADVMAPGVIDSGTARSRILPLALIGVLLAFSANSLITRLVVQRQLADAGVLAEPSRRAWSCSASGSP